MKPTIFSEYVGKNYGKTSTKEKAFSSLFNLLEPLNEPRVQASRGESKRETTYKRIKFQKYKLHRWNKT